MISFNYDFLPCEEGNNLKKPILKITLKGEKKSFTVIGLLDTGADISVLPKGLALYLGLKLENEATANGIGGKIKVWNSKADMKISKGNENYLFSNIPVQVTEDDKIPIIFGRNGLFRKFEIIVDEASQKIKLKRKTKQY